MKVTVFGGAGFLGSHICDKLSEAGHSATIFDIHPSRWLRVALPFATGNRDFLRWIEAESGPR